MDSVRQWYPECESLGEQDLVKEIKPSTRGDLADMLALKELLPEEAPEIGEESEEEEE